MNDTKNMSVAEAAKEMRKNITIHKDSGYKEDSLIFGHAQQMPRK